jgi:hypothetical protein
VGGASPHISHQGVQGGEGAMTILEPPLAGDSGEAPPKRNFGKIPCKIL